MSNKENILLVGCLSFPLGTADTYRQLQLAQLFQKENYNVTVVNRFSLHNKNIVKNENISYRGYYHDIPFFYCSFSSYRSESFIKRNVLKTIGILVELLYIGCSKVFKNTNTILVNSTELKRVKFYYYLSKIFRLRLLYDYVEYVDSLKNREEKIITNLPKHFDHSFGKYINGCIVISNFLKNHLQFLNSTIPIVKIPPATNFDFIKTIEPLEIKAPYFLYCGSAHYSSAIKFITKAYLKSKAIKNGFLLRLVINGKDEYINRIKNYINTLENNENIQIISGLTYPALIANYKSASALLIPLSTSIQDRARFPFKICEYTASKRPIISSCVGVVNEYFSDEFSALIAEADNDNSFANKMNFIISNKDESDDIGYQGYLLGKENFNTRNSNSDIAHL